MPIRRLARLVIRRPGATLAALAAMSVWSGIAVNALVMQDSPHPAPLIGRGDHIAPGTMANRDGAEDAERRRAEEERRALVRELQALLAERGFYAGIIDGLAGPMTAEAIRAFEEAAGLEVTGEPRAVLLAQIELSGVEAPRPPLGEERAEAPSPAENPMPPESEAAASIEEQAEAPQSAHDFAETGLPGMSTLTEADTALMPPSQAAALPTGDPRIAAVQRVLADLGYAPGRIDGQLGPQTQDAIRRFQHDRGLAPSGELDDLLIRELAAVSGESLG